MSLNEVGVSKSEVTGRYLEGLRKNMKNYSQDIST
jgi:hypothetical protein